MLTKFLIMDTNTAQYWDSLYEAIPVQQFTWYEQIPFFSLKMITMLDLPLSASIIDVGGGTGFLAKQLLALGYSNITVLDFSERAIADGKQLLGEHAGSINWLQMDVLDFKPAGKYDLWHDRACFHFLYTKEQQQRYSSVSASAVDRGGNMLLAAAAENASGQSTGLTVQRHSLTAMKYLFANDFNMEICLQRSHITPANRLEPYTYYSFKRRS
jgi:SAM-dependent methyltransferase